MKYLLIIFVAYTGPFYGQYEDKEVFETKEACEKMGAVHAQDFQNYAREKGWLGPRVRIVCKRL